jgi:hypothetical protein
MTEVRDQRSGVGNNTGAKLMTGKIFVWLLATVLLTTASSTEAQQPAHDFIHAPSHDAALWRMSRHKY